MLVHPRPGRRERTFLDVLRDELVDLDDGASRADLVHRLDRGTSGLMVIALSKPAARTLTAGFRDKEISKGYLALVFGRANGNYTVDVPLGKVLPAPAYWGVDLKNGLKSETHFEAVWSTEDCSLLLVRPITGRTHQIRIHTAHKGYPIVGDRWYCTDLVPKTPWQQYLLKNARRLCLHAYHISFRHPVHNGRMSFWCSPPSEFIEVMRNFSANVDL